MNSLCPICQGPASRREQVTVRKKYRSNLLHCNTCGFTFLENPTWLAEAYESPIEASDTGYVARNIQFSKIVEALILGYLDANAAFLDFGAGYGLFVRLMRDLGFNFKWQDAYTTNLFARGFEWQAGERVELATAFEVFEHLPQPSSILDALGSASANILFSTELIPEPLPGSHEWWYYGLSHGQHVSFHTARSLTILGEKHGYKLLTDNQRLHMFHRGGIPPAAITRSQSWLFHRLFRQLRSRPSLMMEDHRASLS